MRLARVIGTVVATRKDPDLEGLTFLLCRPCDEAGKPTTEAPLVAADAVGAGVGEVVLFAVGSAARQTRATKDRAVDATLTAIVDLVESGGEERFRKQADRG